MVAPLELVEEEVSNKTQVVVRVLPNTPKIMLPECKSRSFIKSHFRLEVERWVVVVDLAKEEALEEAVSVREVVLGVASLAVVDLVKEEALAAVDLGEASLVEVSLAVVGLAKAVDLVAAVWVASEVVVWA